MVAVGDDADSQSELGNAEGTDSHDHDKLGPNDEGGYDEANGNILGDRDERWIEDSGHDH